jgi:hypothetical protein
MDVDRAQGTYDFSQLLHLASATAIDDSDLLAAIEQWWDASGKLRTLYLQVVEAEQLHAMCPQPVEALNKAKEAVLEVITLLHDLEDRIARARAVTSNGRRQKARMVLAGAVSREDIQGELEKALDDRSSTGQFIGFSLILDLLHE